MPWVEKYRPKALSDVAHQTETVATLTNAVATGNLPHLLFYGPPGTGKTTMALALARSLWGPRIFKNRVMEMNASDERGISVVRNKIKVGQSEERSMARAIRQQKQHTACPVTNIPSCARAHRLNPFRDSPSLILELRQPHRIQAYPGGPLHPPLPSVQADHPRRVRYHDE